jgi:glycosyltransferase involved in cell wall biosynthesis
MSRNRIAMNLLWCVPGVGGSEEYLVRQLLGLAEIEHEYDVEVFAPLGFSQRQPRVAALYTVHEAANDCSRRSMRIWLEHTWLAKKTRGYSLVHHGGGTLPRRGNSVTVLTMHDIQWIDYPHYVAPVKLRYLKRVVPSSVRRASRVTAPSRFVADSLTQAFGTASQKIGIVRHGLENDISAAATDESTLRMKFSLGDGPVLVFPAITHPHKNHLFLLQLLMSESGAWADPSLRIVFAGSEGSHHEQVLAFIAEHDLSSRVVMPGRVSHEDRNGLLKMADAMVFPSEYEGFGAPVIEAMRMGAPVICSDRASLPGVVGDAGLVLPLTKDAWAHALDIVRARRAELVALGHSRSQLFTAALSATDLVEQYRIALDGRQ